MRIVLDTHVLAAGLLRADSMAGRVLDLLRAGNLRLAVDDRILREYDEVLASPPLARCLPPLERARILAFLHADAERHIPTTVVKGLPDPKDASFAETALAADAPLVTDDFRRFPAERCGRMRVFSLVRFLEEIDRPR